MIKGGVDVVNRDRVVWVSRITTDIDHHSQRAGRTSSGDGLIGHKAGDLVGEVNAVDKDVDYHSIVNIPKSVRHFFC